VCATDVSPLPASTVPTPAKHFAVEALPSTAATHQTVADTPRKPVDAAEVTTSFLDVVVVTSVTSYKLTLLDLDQHICSIGEFSVLRPLYIKDSATRYLETENSTELTARLNDSLSQTVVPCDLYVMTCFS